MKKSTIEISAERLRLQQRRERLAADVASANRDLEAARQSLIEGASEAAQVTGAQATFTALSEALAAVDEQLSTLGEELAAAEARSAESAKTEREAELHAERTRLQTEYAATWIEADEAFGKYAARLLDLRGRNGAAVRELSQLEPPSSHTTYTSRFAERELRNNPSPFGDVLVVAMQTLANKLERERLKNRVSSPRLRDAA